MKFRPPIPLLIFRGAVPSVSVKSGTFEVVHSLPPLKKKTVEGRSKLSEGDGEGEVEEVLNLWWA